MGRPARATAMRWLAAASCVAVAAGGTHLALERADGPGPAPRAVAGAVPDEGAGRERAAPETVTGDLKISGVVSEVVADIARGSIPGTAELTAVGDQPRWLIDGLAVDGRPRRVEWSGGASLRIEAEALLATSAELVGGPDGVVVDVALSDLRIGSGTVSITGPVQLGSPGPSRPGKAGLPSAAKPSGSVRGSVVKATTTLGSGRARARLLGPDVIELHAPVTVAGQVEVTAGRDRGIAAGRVVVTAGVVRLALDRRGAITSVSAAGAVAEVTPPGR